MLLISKLRVGRKSYADVASAVDGALRDLDYYRQFISDANNCLGVPSRSCNDDTRPVSGRVVSPSREISNKYYRKILWLGSWANSSWVPRF